MTGSVKSENLTDIKQDLLRTTPITLLIPTGKSWTILFEGEEEAGEFSNSIFERKQL